MFQEMPETVVRLVILRFSYLHHWLSHNEILKLLENVTPSCALHLVITQGL